MSSLFYATRSLLRHALFTTVPISTLALGIGACISVFSVVSAVLIRPLPYAHPESLTMLWERNAGKGQNESPVSPANFGDWRSQSRVFRAMAAFSTGPAGL